MTTTRTSVLIVAGGALLAGTMLGSVAIAQDKIKIGFSQGTMESSWRVNMVERNKQWYEANIADKADLIITNGENDASKQVADVESLLAQGIKILVISPVTAVMTRSTPPSPRTVRTSKWWPTASATMSASPP